MHKSRFNGRKKFLSGLSNIHHAWPKIIFNILCDIAHFLVHVHKRLLFMVFFLVHKIYFLFYLFHYLLQNEKNVYFPVPIRHHAPKIAATTDHPNTSEKVIKKINPSLFIIFRAKYSSILRRRRIHYL